MKISWSAVWNWVYENVIKEKIEDTVPDIPGVPGSDDKPVPETPVVSTPGRRASFLFNDAGVRVMNLLSPHFNDTHVAEVTDRCIANGDNEMHVFLQNEGDGPGAGWSLYHGDKIGEEINHDRVSHIQKRIDYFHRRGLRVYLWLRADDSPHYNRTPVDKQLAYQNDAVSLYDRHVEGWCVGLELDEYTLLRDIKTYTSNMKELSNKPIGVHFTNLNKVSWATQSGADTWYAQYGFGKNSAQIKSLTEQYVPQCPSMDFIAFEYHKSSDTDAARSLGDAAMRGGAKGTGNGVNFDGPSVTPVDPDETGKVFSGILNIQEARGVLSAQVKDASFICELTVFGSPEQFADPVGKDFTVHGRMVRGLNTASAFILNQIKGDLSFVERFSAPVSEVDGVWRLDIEAITDHGVISVLGNIPKDWSAIRGVSAEGDVSSTAISLLVDDIELAGELEFKETITGSIEVPAGPPSNPGDSLDLSQVIWLHTDVSGWPVTSQLGLQIGSGDVHMTYDKANVWEGKVVYGTLVNANPWVFVQKDGKWYGATWEWLRPGQQSKEKRRVAGDHIKKDPLKSWRPVVGEKLGFMVSGLARSNHRNSKERTNVVMTEWK